MSEKNSQGGVAQAARVWIGSPDPAALAHRLEAAYDKVKEWPERSPTGFLDLLELRNLMPETVSILRALAAQPPETSGQEG